MNPKLLLFAVVPIAIVAIAALLLVSGGDDDGDTAVSTPGATATVPGTIVTAPTASPTPTLGTAPDATPTPVRSAEEQARNLKLIEAPSGMLEFVTDGPYVVPGDALGVFYLDIETKQIEGWFDLARPESPTIPIAFSGENRFTLFERPTQSFSGDTIFPAGYYLGDRETRSVHRWSGDAEVVYERSGFGREITARGDLVLFRVPVRDGDDWLTVFNVTENKVVTAFQAEAGLALIAGDGSRIAFATWTNTSTAWATEVWAMELESGDELFRTQIALDNLDLEGTLELIESRDGGSFVFVANPVKARFRGLAARYSWDGRVLSQTEGQTVFISPYGDFVAAMEPLTLSEDGETNGLPLNLYTAYDMSNGSPLFRVSGATRYVGRSDDHRWLADGSGFAVGTAGPPVMAMADGSLRDLPGLPSPTDVNVFAVDNDRSDAGAGAVDASGNPIATVTFQGGVRDLLAPWGDHGDEVRLLIPHGGHGGPGLVASSVQPYVEAAPFAGPAPLQLSDVAIGFGLVDLYAEPGGVVTGQVAAPHRVVVEEVVRRCSGDFERNGAVSDCETIDGTQHRDFVALVSGAAVEDGRRLAGTWARVTTPDGQQGWLLLQVNGIGI